MKKLLTLLALTALSTQSFAFIAEPSVKGAALGGAYYAGSALDPFAASYNPASQTYAKVSLGAAWHKAEGAESIYSLGYGYNFSNGIALNAFGNYLHDGGIDADNKEIKIGASFSLMDAGINIPLTVGLNLKQGWLDARNVKEHALVGDIGFVMRPLERFKIGAVYSNIGGKKGLYTDDTYGIGASYLLTPWAEHNFDLRFDLGQEDSHGKVGLGVEWTHNIYALRLGYIDADYTDNFTFGAGIDLGRYGRADAAYLPYDKDKTYKLSYSILFGNKYYAAAPTQKAVAATPAKAAQPKKNKTAKKSSAPVYTETQDGQYYNTTPHYGNVREIVYQYKQPTVNPSSGVQYAPYSEEAAVKTGSGAKASPTQRPQRYMK